LDTKLRNYDETEMVSGRKERREKDDGIKVVEARSLRPLGCFLGGLGFIAATTLLMKEVCRIFWLYDYANFLGWAPDEFNFHRPGEAEMELFNSMLSEGWKMGLIYLGVALVALALCIWLTGKKLNWFDKIFTEVQVILLALAVTGLVGMAVIQIDCLMRSDWYTVLMARLGFSEAEVTEILSMYSSPTAFEPQWLETFFACVASAVLIGLCLLIVLSWVKKLKAHCFWRTTLVGGLVCAVVNAIKESKGVQGKIILILLIGALLSATWIGLIAVLVFIIFYVPKLVKKYVAIRDGVEEVKDGNMNYKIETLKPGEKPGELDRLAMSINEISDAMSVAVANEMKNQRMKTDLISNVSHDLKTPLTSMVSYVDLLKTEGLESEHALEYLDIIDEKTRRLRKLTEDLFEAAKASSGSIPVHIERIEMTSIIGQALAEVEERLAASDLEVIFTDKTGSVPGEGTYVMADGQLLWRVMENLLVNVSKYALPGSRVYMDLVERPAVGEPGDMSDGMTNAGQEFPTGRVVLEIKNMSKDRLNIDAEELMERFKRGDESRNTEGSGLGLAIAKDLVKLMDGEFGLTVDGDLFKASVSLAKA